MSQPETDVRPTLARTAHGNPIALGTEEQTALVAWFLKTVLMEHKALLTGPRTQQPALVRQNGHTRFHRERTLSSGMRAALAELFRAGTVL
ncbi:hypothetical protein NGM33_11075 [Nocardiopsis dassonvillei]|uniref:hypothetical protein n=1 Tax=Nocardiopsis dassonvillei TaxID=2014 RepID=UPI0020A4B921|nr:hypothetical protein [Nocardiopsis dassonvillei]MCP3013871.1 hypothetical protein [Nocardiopsis dassonvillei]